MVDNRKNSVSDAVASKVNEKDSSFEEVPHLKDEEIWTGSPQHDEPEDMDIDDITVEPYKPHEDIGTLKHQVEVTDGPKSNPNEVYEQKSKGKKPSGHKTSARSKTHMVTKRDSESERNAYDGTSSRHKQTDNTNRNSAAGILETRRPEQLLQLHMQQMQIGFINHSGFHEDILQMHITSVGGMVADPFHGGMSRPVGVGVPHQRPATSKMSFLSLVPGLGGISSSKHTQQHADGSSPRKNSGYNPKISPGMYPDDYNPQYQKSSAVMHGAVVPERSHHPSPSQHIRQTASGSGGSRHDEDLNINYKEQVEGYKRYEEEKRRRDEEQRKDILLIEKQHEIDRLNEELKKERHSREDKQGQYQRQREQLLLIQEEFLKTKNEYLKFLRVYDPHFEFNEERLIQERDRFIKSGKSETNPSDFKEICDVLEFELKQQVTDRSRQLISEFDSKAKSELKESAEEEEKLKNLQLEIESQKSVVADMEKTLTEKDSELKLDIKNVYDAYQELKVNVNLFLEDNTEGAQGMINILLEKVIKCHPYQEHLRVIEEKFKNSLHGDWIDQVRMQAVICLLNEKDEMEDQSEIQAYIDDNLKDFTTKGYINAQNRHSDHLTDSVKVAYRLSKYAIASKHYFKDDSITVESLENLKEKEDPVVVPKVNEIKVAYAVESPVDAVGRNDFREPKTTEEYGAQIQPLGMPIDAISGIKYSDVDTSQHAQKGLPLLPTNDALKADDSGRVNTGVINQGPSVEDLLHRNPGNAPSSGGNPGPKIPVLVGDYEMDKQTFKFVYDSAMWEVHLNSGGDIKKCICSWCETRRLHGESPNCNPSKKKRCRRCSERSEHKDCSYDVAKPAKTKSKTVCNLCDKLRQKNHPELFSDSASNKSSKVKSGVKALFSM